MSIFTAVSAMRDNDMLIFALLLICISLMIYLSKHWLRVSARDRDAARRKKFDGILTWSDSGKNGDDAPQSRRKRPDDAFESFLRS